MEESSYGTSVTLKASNSIWNLPLSHPLRLFPFMLSGYKQILDPIFPAFRVPQLHFPSKRLAHSIVYVIHFLYPMKLSSVKTNKYTKTTESPPPPKTNKTTHQNQFLLLCLETRGWTSSSQEQRTTWPGTELEIMLHHVAWAHMRKRNRAWEEHTYNIDPPRTGL